MEAVERYGFARIMAAERTETKTIMIDATYLKAHRMASKLRLKKGAWSPDWPHEYHAACCHRCDSPPDHLIHVGGSGQRLHRRGGLAGGVAKG